MRVPPGTYRKPTVEDRFVCRSEFIAGKGNSPDIAARHGLNPITVKGWMLAGKWTALRDRRDKAQLARLAVGLLPSEAMPEPLPGSQESEAEILRGHLAATDDLLHSCDNGSERLRLAKARESFAEQLSVALNGGKPGTLKPGKRRPGQSSAPAWPQPSAGDRVPAEDPGGNSPLADVSQALAQSEPANGAPTVSHGN